MARYRCVRDGEQRRALQVICDSVIGSRTARPGGRRQKAARNSAQISGEPFNDEVPM